MEQEVEEVRRLLDSLLCRDAITVLTGQRCRVRRRRVAPSRQPLSACYPHDVAQSDRSRPAATYEDLLKVPDHLVAEIVDGELYATPRPAPRHAAASSGLGGALHGPFDRGRGGPGGWRILDEPELHLGADVIVPDVAGWRRERLPLLPEEAYFSLAPDWICEVLSPSTAALDRVRKLRIYSREQVSHAWLVDPILQTLEVLRLENARWTITSTWSGSDIARAEPFDAIDVDLTLLWDIP
jgi:Uma2 family endonuclease